MAKIEGAAMAELPGIPALTRSRGRPATGCAKTAAQRKADQRAREAAVGKDDAEALRLARLLVDVYTDPDSRNGPSIMPYFGRLDDSAIVATWALLRRALGRNS